MKKREPVITNGHAHSTLKLKVAPNNPDTDFLL